ncbi:hypothetical protein B0H11DRAFT_2250055 [Mycena galericulata]|nr:hypothetical protein B0H11DRAFT_2250055 [Mycena galericulata]
MPLDETSSAIPRQNSSPRFSTGCGTLVHNGERGLRTGDTWFVLGEAVEGVVVHLEDAYFCAEGKIKRALGLPTDRSCGCAEEGLKKLQWKCPGAVYTLGSLPEWPGSNFVHRVLVELRRVNEELSAVNSNVIEDLHSTIQRANDPDLSVPGRPLWISRSGDTDGISFPDSPPPTWLGDPVAR